MRRKPDFFDYARANGTKSTGTSVSTGRRLIGAALHTKLPDHRGCAQPSQAFPRPYRVFRTWSYLHMTWPGNSMRIFGSKGGKKGGKYAKKLNHTDHRRSVGEMRQSPRHIRELSFIPSFLKSERTRRLSRGDEPKRDRSMWKVGWGGAKDEEPKRSRQERRDHCAAVR